MQTTLQHSIQVSITNKSIKTTVFTQFINWCETQEKNRFLWLAAALVSHGCALTPITLFAVILSGNLLAFWILAIVAMMSALVTNLAAMPTKYTIPAFLFSVLLDLVIIISCIAMGFNYSATQI